MPKGLRRQIDQEEEMAGFLDQSRISGKNQKRLQVLLEEAETPELRDLAGVLLEFSRIASRKKGRWKPLRHANPDLIDRLAREFPGIASEFFLRPHEEHAEYTRLREWEDEMLVLEPDPPYSTPHPARADDYHDPDEEEIPF